jgi:ABC-2 type transport system permease protein
MFFLFFTVGIGARSLLSEREAGTLARLRSSPIQPATVLLGKALSSFAIAMLSMLSLVVASSLLLGAQWGSPLAVLCLVAASVLAVMGITAVVMSLAKTEQAATGYTSMVAIVFALLGGNFLPSGQGPSYFHKLALITPNGWALRAFSDLGTGAHGLGVIAPSLIALLLFAAATGALAATRAPRMVAL